MDQRLVDTDGVRLMIHRSGHGAPPVIGLSCAGGAHEEWSAVAQRLGTLTEVITYGRPGLGGSDPLFRDLTGRRQTIAWAATQLHTLLRNALIPPPYVLLTSSIGSWIADRYATAWPEEVAGMLLIDPTNVSAWPELDREPTIIDGDDDEPGCMRLEWADCYAELARSAPPPQPRSVVISGSDNHWARDSPLSTPWFEPLPRSEVDARWQTAQREWADRLSARLVVADTGGHLVHRDQPDLVAHVTAAIVRAARLGEGVDLEPHHLAAAGGRLEPVDR